MHALTDKLAAVRGEIIHEIEGLCRSCGRYDIEQDMYTLPALILDENNPGSAMGVEVSGIESTEATEKVTYRAKDERLVIETDLDTYYAEELYADELANILEAVATLGADETLLVEAWKHLD